MEEGKGEPFYIFKFFLSYTHLEVIGILNNICYYWLSLLLYKIWKTQKFEEKITTSIISISGDKHFWNCGVYF